MNLYVQTFFSWRKNTHIISSGLSEGFIITPCQQKVNNHCFKVKTLNKLNLYGSKKVKYISNAKKKYLSFKYDTVFAKCSAPPSGISRNKRVHCSTWCDNLVWANFRKRQWWHTNHLDPQMSGQHNPGPTLQLPLQYCRAHWRLVEEAFLQS